MIGQVSIDSAQFTFSGYLSHTCSVQL